MSLFSEYHESEIHLYQDYILENGEHLEIILAAMPDTAINRSLMKYYREFLEDKGFHGLIEKEIEKYYDFEEGSEYELCEDIGVTYITKIEADIITESWRNDIKSYMNLSSLYTEFITIASRSGIMDFKTELHCKAVKDLNHLMNDKSNYKELFMSYAFNHPVFDPKQRFDIIRSHMKMKEMNREYRMRKELSNT